MGFDDLFPADWFSAAGGLFSFSRISKPINMQHIDKEIYAQEGVKKRLQPLNKWYYILSVLGIACTLPYLLIANLPGIVSVLLLTGLVIGDCCLLIAIFYYPFGDSRKPYSKADGAFLERSFDYYPVTSRQQLEATLTGGEKASFDKIKRCPTSDLMVVRYDNERNSTAYCQLLEQRSDKEVPLTEVFILK